MDSDMLASSDEKGTPFTYAYTSRYGPARKISLKAYQNYQISIKGSSLKGKAQRFPENPSRPSYFKELLQPNFQIAEQLYIAAAFLLHHTELVFLNVYGVQESIPRNEFRQPI
jgi:hypothetical protein